MGMLLRRYHKEKVKEVVDYNLLTIRDLKKIAKEKGIDGYNSLSKDELIEVIKNAN